MDFVFDPAAAAAKPRPRSLGGRRSRSTTDCDSTAANSASLAAGAFVVESRRKLSRRRTQSEIFRSRRSRDDRIEAESAPPSEAPEARAARRSAAETGAPSPSALEDLKRALRLIEEERHLVARDLYADAKGRLDDWKERRDEGGGGGDGGGGSERKGPARWRRIRWRSGQGEQKADVGSAENEEAYEFMMRRIKEFEALEKRAAMFRTAQQNLNAPASWTLSQTLFGITTHYRREADRTLSVKIEGELHGTPLFEQVAVLRECDLYHSWAPFCTESRKLAQLDKLDVVAWYRVGAPAFGLARDAAYRAVGCDCMREDGTVLLVAVGLGEDEIEIAEGGDAAGEAKEERERERRRSQVSAARLEDDRRGSSTFRQSADSSARVPNATAASFLARDEILSTIALPPVPAGLGHGRMTIRNFSAQIDILSASSARTKMVVNVDPNLGFLPQSLIDFCMKRMCGVLLARLQAAARKVVKDPVKNPHSRRMREDVRFYRDWLYPKFRDYCDESGWIMPPVRALEVSEEDLETEEIFEGWRSDDGTRSSRRSNDAGRDTHAAVQRYRIADKSASVGDDCAPSPSPSDRSAGASCGRSAASPATRGTRKRDKLKQFFQEQQLHRRTQSRDEKIAADREAASLRLKPEPFSESKALRLKELKHAKARAEERLRRSKSGGLSSSERGSIGADIQSTASQSECSSSIQDAELDRDLKRDAVILSVSLLLNLALMRFQSFALKTLDVHPFFDTTHSYWAGLLTQNLLSLLMIALHATSLWATLNTCLVVAFDTIDFGQKHLAKNLEYGKRLYVDAVKKYSKLTSVAVAAVSFGVGVFSATFQNTIHKICSWLSKDFATSPSKYSWMLDSAAHWLNLIRDSAIIVMDWLNIMAHRIHFPLILKYVSMAMSWTGSCVSNFIPMRIKHFGHGTLVFLFKSLPNSILSNLNMCKHINASPISWRSEAVHISSFITTRLGVFLVALLFMSYLVLPTPNKKMNKSEATKHVEVSIKGGLKGKARTVECHDADSLSDVSARTGNSQKRHDFPMEAIEE